MRADLVALDEVVRLPRNAKEHDLGEIDASIRRFGFLERVVINETTGHLISGHGRLDDLQSAKARGHKPPKNIEVDSGRWMVPVDYVDVPVEEEEAAALALNKLVERGGWDERALADTLADLAAQGEKMLEGTGFDTDDLDELLKHLAAAEETAEEDNPDEDDHVDEEDRAAAAQLRLGVKLGDVFRVGVHAVVCGDCKDETVWKAGLSAVGREGVNGVFTSPPYAEQRKNTYGGVPVDQYVDWWEGVQAQAGKYLADDGSFFVNIKPHSEDGERSLYVMELALAMAKRWGWKFIDEFSWARISAPGSWPNRFKNGFEPIYQFSLNTKIKFKPKNVADISRSGSERGHKNRQNDNYYNTGRESNVITWDESLPSNRLDFMGGNASGTSHAAAFPVDLPEFFIRAYSEPGDLWIDPFGGSGSTALAADRNGRLGLIVEIVPEYAALSIDRLEEATGLSSLKVNP